LSGIIWRKNSWQRREEITPLSQSPYVYKDQDEADKMREEVGFGDKAKHVEKSDL